MTVLPCCSNALIKVTLPKVRLAKNQRYPIRVFAALGFVNEYVMDFVYEGFVQGRVSIPLPAVVSINHAKDEIYS